MPQSYFSTSSLPPSMEFGFWDRIRWAIMGNGRGKFGSSQQRYFPVDPKIILIDTSPGSLMTVAMEVPHLNTVISTGAELFSLMEIKHLNKAGEEIPIEKSKVLQFLKEPNPLQTLEQYLYQFYVLNSVYNKTFQHKIVAPFNNNLPSALWLLPSGWMKINTTGKIYRQTRIEDIILNYQMLNDPVPYDVANVIYMSEGIGNSILNPISRIEALQIPLSNIVASLKSRNIIVSERGMIGFMTPDAPSKDSDGQLPFDADEHARIRKEYQQQYSLDGQGGHVGFPKVSMKWVPMTFDIKQLGLLEGVEDDFAALCAAFRHDRDIYPSVKGATYENKNAGMKATIQNGLQPLADKLMMQLTKHLLDASTGETLQASYDYLPIMKEDERLEAQGKLYLTQACGNALNSGVISRDQYAQICGFEMDGDKVIQNATAQAQSNPAADNQQQEVAKLLRRIGVHLNGN